jgi:hypothetical protein
MTTGERGVRQWAIEALRARIEHYTAYLRMIESGRYTIQAIPETRLIEDAMLVDLGSPNGGN